jgi:hypothetical protein
MIFLALPLMTLLTPSACAQAAHPVAAVQQADEKKPEPEKKRKARFTVGKDTTYVTSPVDAQGYIDYAAALYERQKKGVTADNNANVLLRKALGPQGSWRELPKAYFRWMDMEPLPAKGDYFIRRAFEIQEDVENATRRVWTREEFPRVAAWLRSNEKPLGLIVSASKRTHYFEPSFLESTGAHDADEALCARALLAVGDGRPEDAWADLLAFHRLTRLTGNTINRLLPRATIAYLEHPKVSAAHIKASLRDYQALRSPPSLADDIDLWQRFKFLYLLQEIEVGGMRAMEGIISGGHAKEDAEAQKRHAKWKPALDNTDWNTVLRIGNHWYDRIVAALRIEDRAARQKRITQLEEDLEKLRKDPAAKGELLDYMLAPGRTSAERGKFMGELFVLVFKPSFRRYQEYEDRAEQTERILQVAFGLAAYQRDHGKYPDKLDALVPDYLAKVPTDLFSGQAMIYRTTDAGYLLYSVGVNGKDDGGRASRDEPPGDDVVLRMPAPTLRK